MGTAFVDGIGFWSRPWPGWPALRAALHPTHAGAPAAPADAAASASARPGPRSLAANERRRAPDAVLLALAAAEEAVAASGHDAAALASVFTSAHGDLPLVDALCRTLAGDPRLLSPTRFHHSVHNAASGYWSIASGSHAASTALAAFDHSFGAGLLEALSQVAADGAPVLLVGADTEASGPLASVNRSRGLLGVALVLSPAPGPACAARIDWAVEPRAAVPVPPPATLPAALPAVLVAALGANALADALPLLGALAEGRPATLDLAVGRAAALRLALHGPTPAGAAGARA